MLYAATFTWTWSLSQPWCFASWYKGFQPSNWQQWHLEDSRLWFGKFFWSPSNPATDKPCGNTLVPATWALTWSHLLWDCCGFMEHWLYTGWTICWQAYNAKKNRGIIYAYLFPTRCAEYCLLFMESWLCNLQIFSLWKKHLAFFVIRVLFWT